MVVAEPVILVCKHCDNRQPDGIYCRACGRPFVDPPPPPSGMQRSNVMRLLAVVLVIGGIYLFHKESAPTPPEATQVYTAPDLTAVAALVPKSAPTSALTADDLVAIATPHKLTLLRHNKPVATALLLEPAVIATTLHSIQTGDDLIARFEDGSTASVHRLAAQDEPHDVAILTLGDITPSARRKANESNAAAAQLAQHLDPEGKHPKAKDDTPNIGSSSTLNNGDEVVSLGPPKGVDNSLLEGAVLGHHGSLLQTNLAVTPANSGAAIYNNKGEVVGLLTDHIHDPVEGQNYALPIEWVIATRRNATTVLAAAATAAAAPSHALSPVTIALAPHAHHSIPFTTPKDLDTVRLTLNLKSPQPSGDIRIKVMRDASTVYDSGDSLDTTFNLKLKRGTYTIVLENTASTTRNAELRGTFNATP